MLTPVADSGITGAAAAPVGVVRVNHPAGQGDGEVAAALAKGTGLGGTAGLIGGEGPHARVCTPAAARSNTQRGVTPMIHTFPGKQSAHIPNHN
jgi:hypothetical protein